mmetsp:Transcript_20895/g.64553  ORF Transcript_20895/g.64553 Transcript_20895/m.64553 type:complete len:213 (-) Transcript_20895:1309-1947(-)
MGGMGRGSPPGTLASRRGSRSKLTRRNLRGSISGGASTRVLVETQPTMARPGSRRLEERMILSALGASNVAILARWSRLAHVVVRTSRTSTTSPGHRSATGLDSAARSRLASAPRAWTILTGLHCGPSTRTHAHRSSFNGPPARCLTSASFVANVAIVASASRHQYDPGDTLAQPPWKFGGISTTSSVPSCKAGKLFRVAGRSGTDTKSAGR